MASKRQNDSLDVILIGRTGDGKSETANRILGREIFPTSCNAGSSTIKAQHDCGHFDGYDLKVVDCPGLGDTRLGVKDDLVQFIEAMQIAISENPIGYHAFLYVMKFGNRVTKVDELTIFIFKQLLGDKFLKNHGILVMTYGDCFETDPTVKKGNYSFDGWLETQDNAVFKDLLKECSYRAVLFDNRTDKSDKQIVQVRKLIKLIESLASNGKRYTNEDFQEAEKKRSDLLDSFRKEQETQDFIDKVGTFISKIKNTPDDENGLETLDTVILEINDLETSVKKALSQNTSLKTLLSLITNMRDALRAKKKQIMNIVEYKVKGAKNEKERNQFQKTRSNDLTETTKKFEQLEKNYVIVKNSSVDPIIPKLMDFMKNRFAIGRLFDRIIQVFKK